MSISKNIQQHVSRFASCLALGAALLASSTVFAQVGVVQMVIAFPPGGPSDQLARILSEQLSKELNQKVLVLNRPGGNGALAAQFVTNAPADGKTIWLTTAGAVSINPVLYPELAYDMKNFAPVSLVVNNREILVANPKNVAVDGVQFVQNAMKPNTRTSIASSGIGSMPHMAMALLAESTKVPFTHIPHKGAAPAITDLMGGHVDGFFGDVPGVLPFIQSGKLKAIGIAAPQRHPLFPEVKTFDEMGIKGMDLNNWSAVYVSKQVPAALVNDLNRAIRRALENPAVKARLSATGTDPQASSPEELAALVQSDLAKWTRIIKAFDIKPE